MNWKIGEAKQRFSEVVRAAEDEPQKINNRDRLVAAVVGPGEIKDFLAWRERRRKGSLADSIRELSRICAEEGYTLEIPRHGTGPSTHLGGCALAVLNPFA